VLVGILAGYGFTFGRAWAGGAAALGRGWNLVGKFVDEEIVHCGLVGSLWRADDRGRRLEPSEAVDSGRDGKFSAFVMKAGGLVRWLAQGRFCRTNSIGFVFAFSRVKLRRCSGIGVCLPSCFG
jgi:hypothetical protein